jgi:hypothetical protein
MKFGEVSDDELIEQMEPFNYFVCFIDEDNYLRHTVGYENLLNVISMKHLFEELVADKEFELPDNIDNFKIDIITKEE